MTAHGYGISSGDNENVLKLDIGWWYNSMNILKKQRTVHLNIWERDTQGRYASIKETRKKRQNSCIHLKIRNWTSTDTVYYSHYSYSVKTRLVRNFILKMVFHRNNSHLGKYQKDKLFSSLQLLSNLLSKRFRVGLWLFCHWYALNNWSATEQKMVTSRLVGKKMVLPTRFYFKLLIWHFTVMPFFSFFLLKAKNKTVCLNFSINDFLNQMTLSCPVDRGTFSCIPGL